MENDETQDTNSNENLEQEKEHRETVHHVAHKKHAEKTAHAKPVHKIRKVEQGQIRVKKTSLYIAIVVIILVIAAGVVLGVFWNDIKNAISPKGNQGTGTQTSTKTAKLDMYVMSMCPYGVQAENAAIPAVKKFGDSVDFNVYFIGSESNGVFQSLHGQPEVDEDFRQVCIIKYAKSSFLDYLNCRNKNIQATDWESCLSNVASTVNTQIKTCAEGDEGKTLLRASFAASTKMGVTGSPTIYVNDQSYQSGRDELSFTRSICNGLQEKSTLCSEIPVCAADSDCKKTGMIGVCENPNTKDAKCTFKEPEKIDLIVINDKTCTDCDATNNVKVTQQIFIGANLRTIDISTQEAKDLMKNLNLQYLPAYILGSNVEKDPNFAKVTQYFEKRGNYYILKDSASGSNYDPYAEKCSNGVDDNGNGLIDCADPDCQGNMVCRAETPKKLDLFVMSMCPYGIQAMNSMKEVITNFGATNIIFNIHYIANENSNGSFQSLHGQAEVNEDLREVCAMKYYPTNYKYMDYIWCRNKAISSTDWQSCATDNGMDAAKIKTCAEGTEGKTLLSDNIKLAQELSIGASPTWMTNNKYIFNGLDAETVKTNFCTYNQLDACSKTLTGNATTSSAAGCGA